MAVLTWRNVDAPDFRPAMEGVRNATNLLSNAFTSAGDAVDQYKGIGTEAADRAIMQRLAGVQDPSQFNADTIIGADGRSASLQTLAGVADRTGTLLEWAAKRGQEQRAQQNQDFTNWGNTRTQSEAAALDAASPAIQQALIAQREGRTADANRILSGLSGLNSTQLNSVISNTDTIGSNDLSRRTSQQNLTQSNWRFGNEQTEYGENRAGDALADAIVQRAPDAQTAAQLLDASGASAAVKNRALARMSALGYQGVYGPVGTGASGVPSGSTSPVSTMTGGVQLPSNIRTVGDMVDTLDSRGLNSTLLGANPAGTATGLYQITGGTWKDFAPKALGSDWRNADIRNPVVQDKVANAIWDSAKNSPAAIRSRWASVTPAQAEQLKGKSWAEARDIISAGETSSRASQILDQTLTQQGTAFGTQQTGQRLAERAAENFANTGQTPNQYLSDLSDTATVQQVAERLRAEGSPLAGTSSRFLEDQIEKYRERTKGPDGRYRMTPAQVGSLMARNIQTDDSTSPLSGAARRLGMIFGNRTPNLGSGRRLNDAAIDEGLRQFTTGQTSQNMEATQSLQNVGQVVQGAQVALQQAEAQLAALQRAGAGRPGYQASIRLAMAQRDAALATLRAAQAGVPTDPTLVPTRDRTTPTTPGETASWTIPGILDVRPSPTRR